MFVGFVVHAITLCGLSYVFTNFKCCHGNNLDRSADLHSVNKLCIRLAVKRVTFLCTKTPRHS